MTQTVVITGASAGIARATARLYGARGASVGLIARGQAGLDGAAKDVDRSGRPGVRRAGRRGRPRRRWRRRPRADRGAVRPHRRVDQRGVHLGVRAVRPDHPGRVPAGHRGQLPGLRARHHGGARAGCGRGPRAPSCRSARRSASAAIPLQSAYCGAKHAINGFTESLRCELMHEHSSVHVTVVQMPAVNTPQFSWVLSRLPRHPQPVPPIYQPEVAAHGVLYAADHPRRKQYWVGGSTAATLLAQKVAPGRCSTATWPRPGFDSQQTDQEVAGGQPAGQPVRAGRRAGGHDHGAHGIFDDRSHPRSYAAVGVASSWQLASGGSLAWRRPGAVANAPAPGRALLSLGGAGREAAVRASLLRNAMRRRPRQRLLSGQRGAGGQRRRVGSHAGQSRVRRGFALCPPGAHPADWCIG